MAAVTAAVVAGVATVAATGMQVAQSQGAFGGGGGGGGGGNPNWKKVPEDPQDKAMSDYYGRLTIANANTRFPGFNEYLASGGDPAKAQMDVSMPDLKPSEAAAMGFTGSHGEPLPGISQETAASGSLAETGLTPEQRVFLATERRRQARSQGQEPKGWAAKVGQLTKRHERLESRIGQLGAVEDPTMRQQRQLERVTKRHERVSGRLEKATGGVEHNLPGY